jgi:poly(3-hydroxybutyrate) depolymerase
MPVCATHGLIALAPQSAKADKWEPTETAFVRKTIDDVIARYNIDSARIAVYGFQAGGGMAWLVGFEHVDRVRALCAVDAAPPARSKPPENDPINRLAFFIATAEKSPASGPLKAVTSRLEAARFPVTQKALGEQPRELTDAELAELARWVDSLDRI